MHKLGNLVSPSAFGLLGSSLVFGIVAYLIGAPMPFMIGGVVGSSIFVGLYERGERRLTPPSRMVRTAGVAAVGAMIGTSVSPDLLTILPTYWLSGLAILPFVLIAHMGGFAIMRFVGNYRGVDAYFASMPGGLIEAVLLGEKAGADVRILTIQHFIRVLSIVVVVPLLFFIVTGEVVGSAAGENLQTSKYGAGDVLLIAVIATIGLYIGQRIRLPAAHLLGPLCLAIALSISGLTDISVPPWLLHAAQFVIGATLGAQFSGIDGAMLRKGLGLGLLCIAYMLMLGLGFGWVLSLSVPADLPAMFISFAAGGLAEMSLIALSLGLSPVIVALHHLVRIFLTIWVGNQLYRWYFREKFMAEDHSVRQKE